MPTFFLAPTANFLQTTLNGAITNAATTITLNSTANVTASGYAVIDRQNSAGSNTPSAREVIYYTGVSGNNLTGVTRGADNSTALAHSDGAIVEFPPTVGMWNNLTTIVSTSMTSDGYLKAIASPVSIGRGEIIQTAIPSIASISQLWVPTGYISNLTLTNSMNASGASLIGIYPSGASGSVLTNRGNALPPVFASTSAALQSKVITATRDLAAANGNVAYIGVGFTPTSMFAIGTVSGELGNFSIGFVDSSRSGYQQEGNSAPQGNLIYITSTSGNAATADVASYDSDGFTLTWTKVSLPTGTAQLRFICFK